MVWSRLAVWQFPTSWKMTLMQFTKLQPPPHPVCTPIHVVHASLSAQSVWASHTHWTFSYFRALNHESCLDCASNCSHAPILWRMLLVLFVLGKEETPQYVTLIHGPFVDPADPCLSLGCIVLTWDWKPYNKTSEVHTVGWQTQSIECQNTNQNLIQYREL